MMQIHYWYYLKANGATLKALEISRLSSFIPSMLLSVTEFMVTKKPARLEGHAFIVGGNSSTLLERKVEFPATDAWVHVAIVYSLSGSLNLYMNSVMVTASDPVISTPWQNDGSAVQVSLGSTLNKRDIFVSYFKIIKGSLSMEEVAQLEQETRKQGKYA